MVRTAKSNVLNNLGADLLMYPIILISNIIVTRILGASDKGSFVFFSMLLGAIVPILFFGMGNGIIYYLSSKKYQPKDTVLTILLLGFSIGLFCAFLFGIFWKIGYLGTVGNSFSSTTICLLLLSAPCSSLFLTSTYILTATDNFPKRNILNIFKKIFLSVFLLVFVLSSENKIMAAYWVFFVSSLLIVIIALSILFSTFKFSYSFNIPFLKDCFNYGIKAWIGNIAGRANRSLDQIFLGFIADPAKLGIYSVAYSVANIFMILPSAVAPVLFNKVAGLKDKAGSAILTIRTHARLIILLAPLIILAMVFSPWIIPWIYGDEFNGSIQPFLILLPGIFLFGVSRRIFQKWLAANDYPLLTSKVQLAGLITSAITFPVLIPLFDIIGAAWASLLAYLVATITAYFFFKQKSNRSYSEMFKIIPEDIKYLKKMVLSFLRISK